MEKDMNFIRVGNGQSGPHLNQKEDSSEAQLPNHLWKDLLKLSLSSAAESSELAQQESAGNSDPFVFECCRICSGRFDYKCVNGSKVSVVCGVPSADLSYKATSFVWGKARPIPISCSTCKHVARIPMSSKTKIQQLLEAVGSGSVWLDALSIDQYDHEDVATQVAAMGKIYSEASCIVALLPSSDEAAYDMLAGLSVAASTLISDSETFRSNLEVSGSEKANLDHICQGFYETLLKFEDKLSQWIYWRRAWTFQEWSLARDIDVACECSPKTQKPIRDVKSSIFRAAAMLANYKLQNGQYAHVSLGFPRGGVTPRFDTVKRLFPFEDYLLSANEIDAYTSSLQAMEPSLGTDHLLGIRIDPKLLPRSKNLRLKELLTIDVDESSVKTDQLRSLLAHSAESGFSRPPTAAITGYIRPHQRTQWITSYHRTEIGETLAEFRLRPGAKLPSNTNRETEDEHFRARLSIMLNAFGTSTREARFEADLICCWASMCNIQYDYWKEDPFPIALRKVIKALRRRGIKVYSFLVNTCWPDLDLQFLKYASEHQQCNSQTRAFLSGTPIFNGRADTAVHLLNSITHTVDRTPVTTTSTNIVVRKLLKARLYQVIPLLQISLVLQGFAMATIGRGRESRHPSIMIDIDIPAQKPETLALTDILDSVRDVLTSVPREALAKLALAVTFWVQNEPDRTPAGKYTYFAWSVVPIDSPFKDIFVGRESQNGTLVLAYERNRAAHLVAYLALSYQDSGTYLLETDEQGYMEMYTVKPQRSDLVQDGALGACVLCGQLFMDDVTLPAFGVEPM